jgi:subtilisin family serine protease
MLRDITDISCRIGAGRIGRFAGLVSALLLSLFVANASAAGADAEFASGHILVQLAPNASVKAFDKAARPLGLSLRGAVYGTRWITVALPANADPRAMSQRVRNLPGVMRASVDLVVRINDHFVPRDPMYKDPAVYCDPLFEICDDQWGLFKVGAENAWHETLGNAVIAVLDSGVDLDHDDLFANIWTNPGEIADNGIDDDGNGIVDDVHGADFAGDNVGAPGDRAESQDGNPDVPEGGVWVPDPTNFWLGETFQGDAAVGDGLDNDGDGYIDLGVFHGTAVAGIAAAMTDNLVPGSTTVFEGMAGACGGCTIMAVRMINAEGSALLSDAVAAVRYAADMGADIINASWGFSTAGFDADSPEIAALADAIDYAVARGVIVVAAAGNSGTPPVHYPAAHRRVIAVGSSSQADDVSAFSSRGVINEVPDNGMDDDGNGFIDDVVDIVAPGEMIWSAWVLAAYDSWLYENYYGLYGWPPGADTYSAADGTSFSTPLVAGTIGLLLARHPNASLDQVREALRSNAWADIGGPGYDAASGFGRLNMVVPDTLAAVDNVAPVADVAGDQDGMLSFQDTGKSGVENVTLDGTDSYDTDGFVTRYSWTWTGSDGSAGSGSGATLRVTLATGPTYQFSLTVEDDGGLISEADVVTVTVAPKSGGGGDGGGGGGGGGRGGGKPKK